VQESLNILVMNGKYSSSGGHPSSDTDFELLGIVSAPLWDSKTSTFAGLLTVTDYLNVVQYYNKNTDRLKDVEKLQLSDLRGKDVLLASPFAPLTNFPLGVEKHIGVHPPETISTSPTGQLYNALTKMLISRARRIPLISYDDQTQRANVTSVITQYRILKFIALNVAGTERLRKPLSLLKLGTYKDICRCSMETPVLDVIQEMVDRNISSVPVVTTDGIVLNVFEAVDVINLLSSNDYSNLSWSVGRALLERNPTHPGIYTCTPEDGLDTIFDTIRKSRVHRLVIVGEGNELKGVLSLSDILHYILIDGDDGTNP
jgi:5'-AMP-activated protein kinase regulatory gamma subunit